jgi:type IV pilus assembly protein PilB
MNITFPDKLKQTLIDEGVITAQQLKSAETTAQHENESLANILVKSKLITQEQLTSFMGDKMHIPQITLKDYVIDREVLELVPEKIARRYKLIPLFKIEDVLTVAMANPLDIIAIDEISMLSRCLVEDVIASEESINAAIDQWYSVGDSRKELIDQLAAEFKVPETEKKEGAEYVERLEESRLKKEASQAPIIKLANSYIAQAILEGASDIHLQPKKEFMEIRFRIDGFLYDKGHLPQDLSPAFLSRIKIISKLDISTRRIPQDGRISLIMRNRNIDIRTSTFPSMYGENIVLRILDKGKGIPGLSELGLSGNDLTTFEKLINTQKGIIMSTGPTGSGKTTTIYSFINTLNKKNKNIIAIEDPIEYEIEGIVQSNVDPKAGLTFANAFRAILRQDPDIIYVGEIRDSETARIALRAALTGHLVISTLHTNDSAGALIRLSDMGIETPLIASALQCSFSQRLARRICPRCKKKYQPDGYLLKSLGFPSDTVFYKGEGCDFCGGIGYKGMIGIFEILVVTKDIRSLIGEKASEAEIREAARKQGMKTLLEDGLTKAKDGITTLEEVLRLTAEE